MGTLGWFWEKQIIIALFEHVQERHGVRLAERLHQVISIPVEFADGGGRTEWSHLRCYEAALYWLFVLLRKAKHGDGKFQKLELSELVWSKLAPPPRSRSDTAGKISGGRTHDLSRDRGTNSPTRHMSGDIGGLDARWLRAKQPYWASPHLLMQRYFPRLHNQSAAWAHDTRNQITRGTPSTTASRLAQA